jgi:hypothetical protein
MNPEEFYIGWQAQAPEGIRRVVGKIVVAVILLALLGAFGLAKFQQTIGTSVFEWGHLKVFTGVLGAKPYPHLLVRRPAVSGANGLFSTYYLVNPLKFGFDLETAKRLDGKLVILKGTLIYRENQTMIEAIASSVRPINPSTRESSPAVAVLHLGRQTLRGEIVDSKCYLGVMNPGQFVPHRACAIRCISGGIPPVLVVRQKDSPPLHFLLVSSAGLPVNKQVLDLVAEPVEITGEVQRQGELLILRADPSTYRRI